ncbi:CHAD domain-containing protein [Agromyces humatus]|uniref:CHAD domain-containing protein n=1 Tax=Agromyces humatus TaxID=279573 RepID=A0ABN2KZY6_9MICO|nr:CHAD domain-containing protein [Agromyces humatus]
MAVPHTLDAGSAIVAALRAIAEELDALEPAALADEPDAVHQLRTRVRRLRSILAAFGPLFDPSVAERIRRRYREFGSELGTVRDIEVRVHVAERALDEAPDDSAPDMLAAVRSRLVDAELEAHRLAHARFAARQRMSRAAARRRMLADFLDTPPLSPRAAGRADEVLGALLEQEAKRTVGRADRLGSPSDADSDIEALHAVRKAGRRLRYAAEAVTREPLALFDERAAALAEAGEDLHDVLGDHRDEVLFAEHVRRSAAHAAHRGEPVALLGLLADSADRRATERLHGLGHVRAKLRRAAKEWASR